MKIKKWKKFLVSILLACTCACSFFGVGAAIYYADGANGAAASNVQSSVETFLTATYKEGDTVTLPKIEGTERILYDPDGNGYVNDRINLNQAGQWKLVYAVNGDMTEYDFIVYPSLYSINGNKSRVEVGKMSDYSKYTAQGRSGIYTQIAYNESVTFNQIIDFSDKTRDDTVLEFSVFPETYPVEDASILVLTFTDVEDPTNQMQVHLRAENAPTIESWSMRCVYIRAGGTGQKGMGLAKDATGSYKFEDESYLIRTGDYNDLWGAHAVFSLRSYGQGTSETNIGNQVFGLSMDYADRKLFCYTRNSGTSVGPHLINDFDDVDIYGDNLWNGFTSGKCRLTISAKNYKTTAFTMLITKLGEQTQFATDYIENDTPAEISVMDADMSKVENLVINKPFALPKAVAYDVFGNSLKVNTQVYTGYKTGSQANIDVKSGIFTPTQLREYTIVYSCIDQWGNKTERVYTLPTIAESAYTPFSVTVDKATEHAKIGQEILIKQPIVEENYVGRYKLEISARLGAEQISLGTYTDTNDWQSITFKPLKSGSWIIAYKYSDMFTEDVTFYSIDVEGGGESFFPDAAPVPKYIIRGADYQLPELYGYDFSGEEGVYKKAELYVTATQEISDASAQEGLDLTVEDDLQAVFITYVLNGVMEQYEIPVVDVGYFEETHNATAYFYGYEGTPLVSEEGTLFNVAEKNGEYWLGFANQVQAYNYRSDLKVPLDAEYSKVSLYLTDTKNWANVLKLSYVISENGKIYYSVNDGTMKPLNELVRGDSFSFRYSALTQSVTFVTAEEKVITNLAGEKWSGFTSHMVWAEIELENVTGENTCVGIGGINNQRFYEAEEFDLLDMMPEFYQDATDIASVNNVGAKVVVPEALGADVLAVGCKTTLIATDPEGNPLTSLDGIVLNKVSADRAYEVELTAYGLYEFRYTVTDDLGRINKRGMFQISVEDTAAPSVAIAPHANSAKLGDKITIADIVITDNIDQSEQCTYSVYVECPDYDVLIMSLSKDKNAFKATMRGTYTVWYFVSDTSGNVTLASYSVYVK